MTIRISKPNKPLTLQEGVKTPDHICPSCGYKMDRAAAVAGPGEPIILPREGSISICMKCAAISIFNADLTLRAITAEEIADLDSETRSIIALVKDAVRYANKRRGEI